MAGDKVVAVAPKITPEMLKAFSGDGDLVSWIAKAKLVAKLSKITDLASFIPLYLDGDALALYLEMDDADQQDADKIEAKLKEAYTDSPFTAYAKLIRLKWKGEPVDVFANEIRRLVGLAGVNGSDAETLMTLAFVNGFPGDVSVELQQVQGVQSMKMSQIISRARIIVAARPEVVAAVGQSNRQPFHGVKKVENSGSGGMGQGYYFKGKCFKCEGPHMAKDCTERVERKKIKCYQCGLEGHMSYTCKSENK